MEKDNNRENLCYLTVHMSNMLYLSLFVTLFVVCLSQDLCLESKLCNVSIIWLELIVQSHHTISKEKIHMYDTNIVYLPNIEQLSIAIFSIMVKHVVLIFFSYKLVIVKAISSVVLHMHNTCLSRLLYVKLSMENNTSLIYEDDRNFCYRWS
jgi:hypothetical protein